MRRALIVLLCLAGAPPAPPGPRVWIVLSPSAALSEEAAEDLVRARPAEARGVLVVEDFNALRRDSFSRDALATIAALEEIGADVAGWDPDALDRLDRWGVERLPAIVVERGDRVHVAYGRDARVSEVLSCSR